jgi:hypothetical protein
MNLLPKAAEVEIEGWSEVVGLLLPVFATLQRFSPPLPRLMSRVRVSSPAPVIDYQVFTTTLVSPNAIVITKTHNASTDFRQHCRMYFLVM